MLFIKETSFSFHHYVVQIVAVNSIGSSRPSKPVFVYVGFSVPKQNINNLIVESPTSSSIKLNWDKWKADDNDLITGYRIHYTPLLSTLSPEIRAEADGGESMEETILTENNELIINDLRKFTEYQVKSKNFVI